MHAMAGYLLDVRSVRREVDRREACGQWVAGSSGEGGAFAMRTPEEKARRAAAGSDDEVCLSPLLCLSNRLPCTRLARGCGGRPPAWKTGSAPYPLL